MAITTTTTTVKAISSKPRTKPRPPPSSSSSPPATTTSKIKSSNYQPHNTDMAAQLQRIASSTRTPYEKKVWSLLCQIPAGQVSTYAILSAHLSSSPRAVGNALRRNPFAPEVPCHRVVATGGLLGGFKGKWPKDGEGITIDEKKMLLRREGVKIDDRGRVLGTPWSAFV
ncbi:6-O-methylguanine DNA methyltransferase [Microdochium trichocladiopsis]|uniref:Methylated-DNA--protein-cysteine methyltransferase n=1 Tax=Microdochium trichocladiopsis TaxID=1682393 RepID=A0A9P9BVW4_9PEZI|nr:6-O-methylguanine DNA methyltransferase [Microdochium trichocladiopsis]KAH7039990.1 6-O-methylguanine DNA methyltransferase [Microdochium trichocladiopsis]